jgi:HlyD family secretion protein
MFFVSEDFTESFRKPLSKRIYLIVVALLFSIIFFLFFAKSSVSIVCSGLVRPITEISTVRPSISGDIHSVLVSEGGKVEKGGLIAIIRDANSNEYAYLNNLEYSTVKGYVDDLKQLMSNTEAPNLKTSLFKEQFEKCRSVIKESEINISKVFRELEINRILYTDKVISEKELFDKEVEYKRLLSVHEVIKREQAAIWQSDFQKYQLQLGQLGLQKNRNEIDRQRHFIYAPISGIVHNIQSWYSGNYISTGEVFCTISPETSLIAECFVNTRDVGLLRIGQTARFQIDAFDYNYFGIITGKIISIDNDFTIIENKPVFKVRCSFDSTQLHLKNGYKGELKKGLSFQARFIVAERTLWQLLFDKIDDWLNPTAPVTNQVAKMS